MNLTLLQCQSCGKQWVSPRYVCSHCLSDQLAPCSVPGKGTVYTFTTVSVAPEGRTAPYHVVVVELEDSEIMVTGNLVGTEPYIGMKVVLRETNEDGTNFFVSV